MTTEMVRLYAMLNHKTLTDAGSKVSRQYRNYQTALINVMERVANGICANLVKATKGHYFTTMFIEKDGKFVYVSFENIKGARTYIDFDCPFNLLVRTAKDENDYEGGNNIFTTFPNLRETIKMLLK